MKRQSAMQYNTEDIQGCW